MADRDRARWKRCAPVVCLLAVMSGTGRLGAQTQPDTLAVLRAAMEAYSSHNGKPTMLSPGFTAPCVSFRSDLCKDSPPADPTPSPLIARLAPELGLPLRVGVAPVRCRWATDNGSPVGMVLHLGRPTLVGDTATVSISASAPSNAHAA